MSKPTRSERNRRNAQHSTGPRTRAGKMRAAQNARKHGLSAPVYADHAAAAEIDAVTTRISTWSHAPLRVQQARLIGEAQADLQRIRAVRAQILQAALGMGPVPEIPDESVSRQLMALDRYERRAVSRRKMAIRAFDEMEAYYDHQQ